jgi:integrase
MPFPALPVESLTAAIRGKRPYDLVFPGPDGSYQSTPTIRDRSWFDKALLDANLSPMTIHDLRHTPRASPSPPVQYPATAPDVARGSDAPKYTPSPRRMICA